MNTTAEVYQRSDGRWDFRIVAAENGNTLCSSDQGYERQQDAIAAVIRVTAGPAIISPTVIEFGQTP